jgi:parallel beta-helix repeat protein
MANLSSTLKIMLVSLIISSCQSAFAATFDVTNFGAVGTGLEGDATDNFDAFEAAIAAAGTGGDTILVPAGVYYIDGRVNPNKDNLILDGYGATIKRVSGGADMSMVEVGTSEGVVIQGLTIDGNRSSMVSSTAFGIRNDYGRKLTIKDCHIMDCETDGIYIANQKAETVIDNCDLTGNNRLGIAFTDSTGYCVVKNCDFSDNTGGGLDIEPNWRNTSGHVIQNCTFDAGLAGDSVLQLFGHSAWHIWDVLIEDCDFLNGAGIRCNKSMRATVRNNTFTGGGAIGFNDVTAGYTGAGQLTVTGNTFDGSPMTAGSNLLANAGFESWTGSVPDSWSIEGAGPAVIDQVSASPLEGVLAAHVDADGPIVLKQSISVTAGNNYTFGGYISYLMKDGGNKPYIYVNFLDAGSGVVKTVNPMSVHYQLYKYRLYEKVMGITEAPVGAVTAEISVGRTDAGGYETDFDGMFFVEGIGNNEDLTASQNKVLRFDFGPGPAYTFVNNEEPQFPHADHIGVNPTTTYGLDPNTGLTYGLFNSHSWDSVSGHYTGNAGGWTNKVASNNLALTYVRLPDEDPNGFVSGFLVDLPNGDYYVTLGGGSVAWDFEVRPAVEEQFYRADDASNENVYILDVAPEPVGSGGPLKWKLTKDLALHAPPVDGYVRTWGANNQHAPNNLNYEYAELTYLKEQIVEVTDGRLAVYGGDIGTTGEDAFYLNFVEIAVVPITDCDSVWANGYGLSADLNRDCRVDVQDLAEMGVDWVACFDPNDLVGCPPPWK